TLTGQTTASVTAVRLDAQDNLTIDSVRLNGVTREFTRSTSRITIGFGSTLAPSTQFSVAVDYHGRPVISDLLGGRVLVSRHPAGGTPVMASLSEPYAASTWWPCIDNPTDKATAEIEITVPNGYQAASNGLLDHVTENGDRSSTYFWKEGFPISTYLISV